jgi:integrase
MDSYDVRFWDIRKLGSGSGARFRVRWAVDGREHCKSFKGRPLADGFLTGLKDAVRVRYAPDGRIFQTARGGILQDSGYNEVWTEARKQALTPAQYRSPLGRRPYDLRHAAVSLWLNSGVPATEVARRAGHGVAVLLKIYAHCIDGQANAANQRIADALGTPEAEQGPGDEGDADSEPAA